MKSPHAQTVRAAETCPVQPTLTPMAPRFDEHLHHEPGHLIRRAHQLAVATFHEVHGRQVTPVQYAVLRALAETPDIDQVTLAEKVALDTSTTADIATRLEAKGWIERRLLARRQRSLRLTAEGRAVLEDMIARVEPMYQRLLAGLSSQEQTDFLRLLAKFAGTADPGNPED